MAYSITAQLRLQTPSLQNINKIRKDVEGALSGLKLNINNKSVSALNAYLKTAAASATKLSSSLQDVGTSTRYINASVASFNKASTSISKTATAQKALGTTTHKTTSHIAAQGNAFDISRKKMVAYLLGGAGVRQLAFALRDGIRESIKFQTELSKVGLISSLTALQTKSLGIEIRKVSSAYGASGEQIATASKLLASAGFDYTQLKQTVDLLGKINVGASFDTGGGLDSAVNSIILLNSVFKQSSAAEFASSLEKINNLSNKYPAEASTLTTGLAITGAAAVNANMSLSDLLSTLVVLKSRTRESDETVATTLRNSITRMNRYQSIDILRSMGIPAVDDVTKRMRPMFDIFTDLAQVVKATGAGDPNLNNKIEQIFGNRQSSRMISLLSGWEMALEAKNEALKNGVSLDAATEASMKTLAGQIQSAKEQWLQFTDSIVQSEGVYKIAKDVNTLSSSLSKLLITLADIAPAIAGISAVFAGVQIGKKFGMLTNMDLPQAQKYQQHTRDNYLTAQNQAMTTGSPSDIAEAKAAEKIMKAADAQFLASKRVVFANMRAANSTNILEKALLSAKAKVVAFSENLKANSRIYASAFLAISSLALSMMEQTPQVQAAFNTFTVGAIAAASGLGLWTTSLLMGVTAILSFSKALDDSRREKETKRLKNIDKYIHEDRGTILTGDKNAESRIDQNALHSAQLKSRELERRALADQEEMGFTEFTGRYLSGYAKTGNTSFDPRSDRANKDSAALLEDYKNVKPELEAQLAKRAGRAGSMEGLMADKEGVEIYKSLKLFDILNDSLGATDRALSSFFKGLQEAEVEIAAGVTNMMQGAGNISGRATSIRKAINAPQRNQELMSLPLNDMERSAATNIEKAFEVLPQIISNTQFNSKYWDQQLTAELRNAGIDQSIISSVDKALDNMTFDEFAASLMNVDTATNSLLSDFDYFQQSIESLTEATRLAAQSLKDKLSTAFDTQNAFQGERSKLVSMTAEYLRTLKFNPDPLTSNRLVEQEAFDLSGTIDPEALGNSLRAYQDMIDNNTASLMEVPRLEDGINRTKTSLMKLADVSTRLAGIEERRSQVEASKAGKLSATESLITDPRRVAKELAALNAAWTKGITNLPLEMRSDALAATRTFESVRLGGIGDGTLTGGEMRNRMLEVEAGKMGMSVEPENAELIRLNQATLEIQKQALAAQAQLVLSSQQTAENTNKLAGGTGMVGPGGSPIPYTPSAGSLPPGIPALGGGGGLFSIPDRVSLMNKKRKYTSTNDFENYIPQGVPEQNNKMPIPPLPKELFDGRLFESIRNQLRQKEIRGSGMYEMHRSQSIPEPMRGVRNIRDKVSLADKKPAVDFSQMLSAAQIINKASDGLVKVSEMLKGLTINVQAKHEISVIHNGAAIFGTLTEQFQILCEQTVYKAMKNMVDKTFNIPMKE